jgi:hypothetical protein
MAVVRRALVTCATSEEIVTCLTSVIVFKARLAVVSGERCGGRALASGESQGSGETAEGSKEADSRRPIALQWE